jgi:hypothetical protein
MKYDESDHLFIRATRTVTDKLGDIFRKFYCQMNFSKHSLLSVLLTIHTPNNFFLNRGCFLTI